MFCIHCGKEINEDTIFCPYCGGKQDTALPSEAATASAPPSAPASVAPAKKPVNWIGIVGLIIAILSIVLGGYYCVASVIAVVFNAVGLGLRKRYSLNGFAIAGLTIGILSLVGWGFVWFLLGSIIAALRQIGSEVALLQIAALL